MKRATTKACLTKITNQYFNDVGTPEAILSDHGTQFTSSVWRETLEALGIRVLFSSIRHPQSNPVERSMREIGRILPTYCYDKHTKWAKYVKFVENCLNLTTYQSTRYTPFSLHYDRSSKEKIFELFPLLKNKVPEREVHLTRANESLQRAFDVRSKVKKTVSKVVLNVGDEVMLRVPHLSDATQRPISKFLHLYEGPYKIIQRVGENAYKLVHMDDEARVKGVHNRFNLRKYYKFPNKSPTNAP